MNYDITPIVTALIGLCAAIITYVVMPWIKSKTTAQQQEQFLKWTTIAVSAAEQIFDSDQGAEKKKAVLDYIKSMGFKVNESQLNSAIEAAVNKLHNELYGEKNK